MLEVAGGFDGSTSSDFTVIRLETLEGWQFTPTYGPDERPTIWDPEQWGGRIPRSEVHAAWAELNDRYRLIRVYADPGFNDVDEPTSWMTEIQTWAQLYGEKVFVPWFMAGQGRYRAVHAALLRFVSDLEAGILTHDNCPTTATHMGNARRVVRGDRYILAKPSQSQKIDAAVTSVLAHEAACDARAVGWGNPEPEEPSKVSYAVYGFA